MSYEVSSKRHGTAFGIYAGETAAEAIAACMEDAGAGEASPEDFTAVEGEAWEAWEDGKRAESWYNGSSKAALIDWATRHGLDIGQGRAQLDDDWNERVMAAYAAQL